MEVVLPGMKAYFLAGKPPEPQRQLKQSKHGLIQGQWWVPPHQLSKLVEVPVLFSLKLMCRVC